MGYYYGKVVFVRAYNSEWDAVLVEGLFMPRCWIFANELDVVIENFERVKPKP